jgi:hypothetical protein
MNQSLLDVIEIELGLPQAQEILTIYINVYDNSLSRKWLTALDNLIANNYHLEKNYCFFGFPDGSRNGTLIINEINRSIQAINEADIGYQIDNHFTKENSVDEFNGVNRQQFNLLHKYFEDLQGTSGNMSPYYLKATVQTRWHIRQLNLLCHEFESWQLSWRKKHTAPEWMRPSQLMCWLNAPRFMLDEEDYELFGIQTIARDIGGVYVGVNKAVGKHHYEVFCDEGRDSRLNELTTSTLKSQTEAAGDFDIEWANNPGTFPFMIEQLEDFKQWLLDNGFDPNDKTLTIGHPKVGQVDLKRSFGTEDYRHIWNQLNTHLNVYAIRTSNAQVVYDYHWWDTDYMEKQVECLG